MHGGQTGGKTKPEEAAACAPEPPVTPDKVAAENPVQQHELINVTEQLKQKKASIHF